MTKYVEHIAKAKDIVYGPGSLAPAREIFDRIKAEMKEIQMDRTLSGIGIAEKQREAQTKGAVELAKIMRANKKAIDAEMDAAEKIARADLSKPNAKPDDATIREFDEQYGALKTELLVFGGQRAATKMLDFMQSITDPYLARTLADDFTAVGVQLRENGGDPTKLRTVYDIVRATAETDNKTQAKRALQEIENLRKMTPINSMASLGSSALGESAIRAVMADHEGYLRSHGE